MQAKDTGDEAVDSSKFFRCKGQGQGSEHELEPGGSASCKSTWQRQRLQLNGGTSYHDRMKCIVVIDGGVCGTSWEGGPSAASKSQKLASAVWKRVIFLTLRDLRKGAG